MLVLQKFQKGRLATWSSEKRGGGTEGEDDDSPKDIYFSFYCIIFNRISAREAMIPHPSPKSPLISKLI